MLYPLNTSLELWEETKKPVLFLTLQKQHVYEYYYYFKLLDNKLSG